MEVMQTTLLAEYLCHIQPLQVRARLLHDESFGERVGLVNRTVITLWGMPIDTQELFTAARCALSSNRDQNLTALEGGTVQVTTDDDGILLKSLADDGQTPVFRFKELLILSACGETRRRALDDILQDLGPTASDFSLLRNDIRERELNDEEVGRLFYEIQNGVTAFQKHAAWSLEGGQCTLHDLVPKSLDYFERFCGPDPGNVAPEEYLGTVLPTYRQNLLRRDLSQGLDIFCLGALRDDLSPGLWTEQLPDDELWDALVACNPERDPFSLLGALDIALGRQHDNRYQAFSEEAIQKLLNDEFMRPDNVNTYELIPVLSQLVLNRINALEGGVLRAPYWKRMCAWMQAGLLARLMLPFSLDLDRFREWGLRNQVPVGVYANIVDLRREPMDAAANMSCKVLRNEIFKRLLVLQSRHEAAGRQIPKSQEINETIARLLEPGSARFWPLPGPLEGHRRAETRRCELNEEAASLITEMLGGEESGRAWITLAYTSQIFNLDEELLKQACEAISRISLEGGEEEREARLEWLIHASCVAAAQRDVGLAKEIADTIVAGSHLATSEHEVRMLLQTLLIAGAAFEEEDIWAEWMENQLAEMAWRLPSSGASKAFLTHLQELKKVVKLSLCIHARAEAICSSAI
jgi:hypothetical protein